MTSENDFPVEIYIRPNFSHEMSGIGGLMPHLDFINITLNIPRQDFIDWKGKFGDKTSEIIFQQLKEKFDRFINLEPEEIPF